MHQLSSTKHFIDVCYKSVPESQSSLLSSFLYSWGWIPHPKTKATNIHW